MPKKIVMLQNRFSYNILQFHIGYCILNSATYFLENIDRKSAPFLYWFSDLSLSLQLSVNKSSKRFFREIKQCLAVPFLELFKMLVQVGWKLVYVYTVLVRKFLHNSCIQSCLPLGEFASAIETLVTAISLIKQSKIASDDRCKILISSLQDTLHGIEEKSYGSK